MNETPYDPKSIDAQIRRERLTLFLRLALIAGAWIGIVFLFALLITL